MSLSDWFILLGALAGWASAFGALIIYLHSGATHARESMKSELSDKIDNQSDSIRTNHRAVHLQVTDLTKTLSDNYVRRDDFHQAILAFHGAVSEIRKDIGEVRNKMYDISRSDQRH